MPLPETLRDPLAAARSMISRANSFDLGLQTGNAEATLTNARAFVADDTLIGEAFHEAARRIGAMRQADSLEEARTSALQAIDSLELNLAQARPNDMAKALGVDWF